MVEYHYFAMLTGIGYDDLWQLMRELNEWIRLIILELMDPS